MKKQEQKIPLTALLRDFRRIKLSDIFPGLNPPEVETLAGIVSLEEDLGCVHVSDIVKTIDAPAPIISRVLRSMENKGLIEREADKDDRRSTIVRTTALGKDMDAECQARMDEFLTRVTKKYGKQNMDALGEKLREFLDIAHAELKDMNGGDLD